MPTLTHLFTHLFTRTANGVTIRGFLTNETQPACGFGPPAFQAELSTAKMVAIASAPGSLAERTKPISAVGVTVVGQEEGDPTTVVTAATGPGVASVRVDFTGGAVDSMAPFQEWVALAGPTPSLRSLPLLTTPVGTLVALDASGKTLASIPLSQENLAPYSMPVPLSTAGCGGAKPCAIEPAFTAPQATTTTPGSKAVSATTVAPYSGYVACPTPACRIPTLTPSEVPPTTLKPPGGMSPLTTKSNGPATVYSCAIAKPPTTVTPVRVPAVTVPLHSYGGAPASG